MAVDEAIFSETSEPLRRNLKLVLAYCVMAAMLGAAVPYAYVMGGSGYSHSAPGKVIAVEKLGGEERRLYTIEYTGADGAPRTTREGERSDMPLEMGDPVTVVFNPETDTARSVNWGERALRVSFIGIVATLLGINVLLIVLGYRERGRRRWLLQNGRVEQGQDPRLAWHSIPLAPQLPPTWSLRAVWFEPEIATWRTVASAKQPSTLWEPQPDPVLLHIYVDPRRPRNAWLPATHHRVAVKKD